MYRKGLTEWEGIKLPEVPETFRWERKNDDEETLTLRVVASHINHPFVLWAEKESNVVSIAPLEQGLSTWRYAGDSVEEGLHIAVARVLMDEWD